MTPQERLVAAHGPFTAAVMFARAETSCSPAQARRLLATLPARRASGSFPARGVAINAAVADPWCAATAFSRSLP